jgi:hypothetical protein
MARFFADENFAFPVVEILRTYGHDVTTCGDAGIDNRAATDTEVLTRAGDEARILLTFNRRHFMTLHQRQPKHAGIVACTFDQDFIALARRIDEAVRGAETMTGRLVRIYRES